MTETYSSGVWTVKSGEEDEFVSEWKAFVTWASEMDGSGTFRLLRDLDQPSRFTSFGSWDRLDAQKAWREHPEFAERLGRPRAHCDEFQSSASELAAEVSS